MSSRVLLQVWQGGAYGEGLPQRICSLLSLQPDWPSEGRVPATASGISVGSCTFLVSSVPALVLFDSGTGRSFVSLAFSHHINVGRESLSRPLRVSIADERAVFSTDVIRGCVLEIFGVEFPIDLVPIAMGDVCVIVGMDWLSRYEAVIDCER
ncbi:unnamed protein product [Lactuca virosa]|uniref:Reverse transcriptase domain-containing protein n=1 Tax=Lactuca virosa TaxID=75947 RepID=A0AAU9NH38_9ASTR|nr:unnamed protein product [Lactuca virosa]